LFEELIKRLEMAGETVEDLVEVAKAIEPGFDRNKAYDEEFAGKKDMQ
jgi:hypothetical protein